ncbi:hypothetical protein E2C01_099786 [Portunus trituberculatus]|uniref:Uncharacterized protein n=1 Tax=Portunus trituberculatus TaxID=210409 RepID=A0A5B7KBB5_PORTR|nr:hypothetical protein [Portunus trituberculatus]
MAGSGVALPIPTTIFGPSRQTPLSVSLTVLPADSTSTSITTSTTSRTTTSANITTNTNTTTTTTTTTTTIFPDKRKSAMAAQDTFQNDYYEGIQVDIQTLGKNIHTQNHRSTRKGHPLTREGHPSQTHTISPWVTGEGRSPHSHSAALDRYEGTPNTHSVTLHVSLKDTNHTSLTQP